MGSIFTVIALLSMRSSGMNRCTVHGAVEVFPQVWINDDYIARGQTSKVDFKEATCPVCWEVAREALRNNPAYILLSTPEALVVSP